MEKQNIPAALCLLALLLAVPAIQAAQPPPFFPDYSWKLQLSLPEGNLPPDSVVFVHYQNESGSAMDAIIVAKENGSATLYSRFPVRKALFTYDDPATPSLDAYWEGSLDSPSGQPHALQLQPVADIAGVLTSQEGAVLADVPVELTCSDGIKQVEATSATGAFSFSRIRAGSCIISASVNGQSVRQDFSLSRGQFASLQLQLRKPDYLLPFACGSIALVGGVLLVAWLLQGKKKGGAQQKGRAKPPLSLPTKRQKDLLATLDSKERAIVEFVVHHHPSAVKVSKLRRDLVMPKTSLTRTLQSLERKQFLKIEKVGFRAFAKLHDFFMQEK